jgi:hypothetical protein
MCKDLEIKFKDFEIKFKDLEMDKLVRLAQKDSEMQVR